MEANDVFIERYLADLNQHEIELINIFRESLEECGCSKAVEQYRSMLKEPISAMSCFKNFKITTERLNNKMAEVEVLIQRFTLNPEKTKQLFQRIQKKVDSILYDFDLACGFVNQQVEDAFDKVKTAPLGHREDGKIFESYVIYFFDCLFQEELIRIDPPQWRSRNLKLDGCYQIRERLRDQFEPAIRVGYKFNRLIVECKNKKPVTNDLMQCFKYTLYFQDTVLSNVPLTLLICRTMPGKNDPIWELLRKIFYRQIGTEARLILIVDIDDLKEMKNNKVKGEDFAVVLKEKISTFA